MGWDAACSDEEEADTMGVHEGAPITYRSRRWGISEDFPEDGLDLEEKEESAK